MPQIVQDDNLLPWSTNKAKNPQSNIRRNSFANRESEHKSVQDQNINQISAEINRSSNAKLSQVEVEEESSEESKSQVYEEDDDFIELQKNVDEDVSTWSQVWTTDEVIVFK